MYPTLSIIGCGKLGRALGRLLAGQGMQVRDILNRSLDSSADAVAFIGAGRAIADYADLGKSDVFLISTPDDEIADACARLAASGRLDHATVVFHCSGALSSAHLGAAKDAGATVASIHPIRSFARPDLVAENFAGTYCGVEGDARALDLLVPLFEAAGAVAVKIDSDKKTLYHSAAVMASNYLVTLMDAARNTYLEAGVAPDAVLAMMAPLVRETLENVLRIGPEAALTGPIARGDMSTVARQQAALDAWRGDYGDMYRQFAALTAELAARKHEP